MKNWFSKFFKSKTSPLASSQSNKYYIEKYKDFDEIIKTKYQVEDSTGKLIDIDGIVNPLKIDNRQQCAVTDDQGQTPHCAAYSICNLCEALIWKKTGKLVNLNADQVYAKAKQIEGNIDSDGTYLEATIKAAFELGGFAGSSQIKIGRCMNFGNEDALVETTKFLIHKYDFLHAGFNIDEGWYTPTLRNPTIKKRGAQLGGHAVLICGYDQDNVYIQNSWSKSWAAKGFGLLPWKLFKDQFMYACYIEGSLNI